MIVKQTETSYSVREVCRNCHGRGIVEKLTEVRITISTVDEEGGSHEG